MPTPLGDQYLAHLVGDFGPGIGGRPITGGVITFDGIAETVGPRQSTPTSTTAVVTETFTNLGGGTGQIRITLTRLTMCRFHPH